MPRISRDAITRNGAWLVLPPLAISFGLWATVPPAYAPSTYNEGIPTWMSLGENLLRVLVFATPAAAVFGNSSKRQRTGWVVYAAGLAIYLGSYVVLGAAPDGQWAGSAVGFTAPAWTPAIWILGIALVCDNSWLTDRWKWWLYLPPSAAFLAFHVGHAALVFARS